GTIFTVSITWSGTAQNVGPFGSYFAGSLNGNSTVCTLSEPYYAATWWPSKDGDVFQPGDNSDKATVTFSIKAPIQYKSTANGVLTGVVDDVPNSRRTYTYATSYPIASYLVCFSTSIYNSWTINYNYGTGTMPVEFNASPVDVPSPDTPTGL